MTAMHMNQELYNQALQGDKPVLVEFWAPWCVYCRRIGPAYDKIAEQYTDTLVVGKMNIDEETELAESLKIEVVPTLVLFKDGKPVGDIVAPESKAKIESFIAEYL